MASKIAGKRLAKRTGCIWGGEWGRDKFSHSRLSRQEIPPGPVEAPTGTFEDLDGKFGDLKATSLKEFIDTVVEWIQQ